VDVNGNCAPRAWPASRRPLRAAEPVARAGPRTSGPGEAVALALLRHRHLRPADLVGARQGADRRASFRQKIKHRRQIVHAPGDDMDDARFALQLAGHGDEAGAEHDRAQAFERLRPDDDIGDSRLVLERHENDALGGAWPLTHQHQARDRDSLAVPDRGKRVGAQDAARRKAGAHERGWMRLQGQRQAPIVLHHMRAERHRGQSRVRLGFARRGAYEQRQIVLVADPVEAAHRP
jgi:hypothetical protein